MAESELVAEAKEAVILHGNGDLLECTSKLKNIQKRILNVDRWELDSSIIWSVCAIIKGEVDKWKQDHTLKSSEESLFTVSSALCCLRNSFVNCSKNQLLVAETEDLLGTVISATQCIFQRSEEEPKCQVGNPQLIEDKGPSAEGEKECKKAQYTLASACVMCLGNMVAANPTTRKLIWKHVYPMLSYLLTYEDREVSHMASMVLHNCLLETEMRSTLSRDEKVKFVVGDLLTLYMEESNFSCFVLFCLELLLCCDAVLESSWTSLTSRQKLLCLDVLASEVSKSTDSAQSKPETIPTSTITFLVNMFKNEADKILCTHMGNLNQDESQVLARLVNVVCTVAASDIWRPLLQQDTSLLITSVYLLRCMNDIGKVGGNEFTPIDSLSELTDEEKMNDAASHPAFGFKCDLIRLIASLVHRHTQNQNQVREIEGLLLLLECTQFDARNPLIKEASIFALRNLLEGNLENQKVIQELKFEGVAENSGLRELGMEALVEGNGIRLQQLDR